MYRADVRSRRGEGRLPSDVTEKRLQLDYYAKTAHRFDAWHLGTEGDVEHLLACQLIVAFLHARDPEATILDVGAGTGRFFRYVRDSHPESRLRIFGIEPSPAQRSVAYAAGVPADRHVDGDATALAFPDDSFDYCTEFGVLHHIKECRRALQEMCRVARKGIFLSDCNRYGQGGRFARAAKYALRRLCLIEIVDLVRTKGRGYFMSHKDGLWFPFSIFDHLDVVRSKFPNIFIWATRPVSGPNLLLGAPQALVVATNCGVGARPT